MLDIIVSIAVPVLALALLVFVLYTQNKKKTQKVASGTGRGKAKAAQMAARFARSNGYRCIAPAHFTGGKAETTLDAVVVGYFGVLGVRALDYGGNIYGSVGEDEWVQIAGKEETRTVFENPIKQAAADVRVIRDALFAAKLKKVPVEVVCVFTDPKVQLALPKNTGHYTMTTFKPLLRREKYVEDAGIDLDAVEKAIRAALAGEEGK